MIEVKYEDLSYGVYSFSEVDEGFGEAVKYGSAKTNLLQNMKIKLPDGKNNMIFILANNMEDTANLVKSRYFMFPPNYKTVFFPFRYVDRFLNRRIRYVLKPNLRKEYNDIMCKGTQLKPYPLKVLKTTDRNVVIPLCELYNAAKPAIASQPIKKVYTGLFAQIKDWMDRYGTSPDGKHSGDKEWNNHILMIDVDSFAFERNARLKDNKTNPLYMLYFLCMRPNEMVKLNIDIDMLICSKGKFMKFNPSKMDPKSLAIFRNSLFRMMGTNLDKYTQDLTADDKKEVEDITPEDPVEKAVDKRLDVHTKNVSPSVKATLVSKVGKKVDKKLKSTRLVDSIKRANAPSARPKSMLQGSLVGNKPTQRNNVLDSLRRKLLGLKGDDIYSPLSTFTSTLIADDDEVDVDDYEIEDEDTPKKNVEEEEEITTEEEPDEEADGEAEVAQYADLLNDLTDQTVNDPEVKEELADEIQADIVPLNIPKATSINSKRDQKLREKQKKVRVNNSTIDEILSREATNVKIEEVDKSKALKTANPNMKKIKFANFNKTYINELYDHDIVAVFDSLKDKEHPFYIQDIKVTDGSTPQNYVNTWHVKLVDENGNPSTITVDIPKFINDRFMLLNGNKNIILTQNFYNPLVKDTPNAVIITTNYNKITVERTSSKSLGEVEKIFSLVKKFSKDSDVFISGNSEKSNMKYISSFEYDELSRNIFRYKSGDTELFFSRQYINSSLKDKIPADIKGDEFYIGHQGKTPILINEDTGKDRQGRSIIQIIEETLPNNMKEAYKKIKAPKRLIYAQCKLAGEWIPAILPLIVWNGIEGALNEMKIKWKFLQGEKRLPKDTSMDYIKFADGILAYEPQIFAQLLLNGMTFLDTNVKTFSDFETEDSYADYVKSKWGSFNGIDQINQFNQFLVDPITKDVCRDFEMPDTPSGLIIGAVKLLADNTHVSKAYDGSYRIRTVEMIPAILYGCVARQYQDYVTKGKKMTLNKNAVITKLLQEKTVENYSTLNPAIEMDKTHSISTKGYKGSNSVYSYDEQKRSYDPSAIGKLAMSTSANAGVGINHALVIEPTILNARGYRDVVPDSEIDNLKDVNVMAPVELLTPGTARNDDPMDIRVGVKLC